MKPLLAGLLGAFVSVLSTSAWELAPRAGCTKTMNAQSTVTASTYVDVDVYYTTTWVTVYAEASSLAWFTTSTPLTSAPTPTASLARRQDSPSTPSSAVSSGLCANTVTLPPATTTITQTYTFSHAARATATAPACAAHNIFNGTVTYNAEQAYFPVGQPRGETHPDLDPVDCCNYCFRGSCVYFTFGTQCEIFWSDGGCPNGWGQTEGLRYPNNEGDKGLTGMGPCLVEVEYYED